jgi:hypothetical protein
MAKHDSSVDEAVYCPRWSKILGKKTACLKENCTNFIPSAEIEGEFFEGFCREMGIFDCLSAIMVSLSIISGQVGIQFPEESTENQLNEPERGLYG